MGTHPNYFYVKPSMGTHRASMGTHHTSMGTHHTSMATHHTSMGIHRTSMGTHPNYFYYSPQCLLLSELATQATSSDLFYSVTT